MRLPINGEPQIGGTGENLQLFLSPLNDEKMVERFGKEKMIDMGSVDTKIGKFMYVVSQGATYRMKQGNVSAFRYLVSLPNGEFIACCQVTKINKENLVSNIYVHKDFREKGLASALIEKALSQRKNLKVDSNLTNEGAFFFGYSQRALNKATP